MYHWARDPDIPAENNRAERGVRGLVIARKTSFGGQSEGALRVREVNQSAIETLALRHADSAGKLAKALNYEAERELKLDTHNSTGFRLNNIVDINSVDLSEFMN